MSQVNVLVNGCQASQTTDLQVSMTEASHRAKITPPLNNMTEKLYLPESGFLRLPDVLKFIPVGKSTWWQGITTGRFPKPIKLGKRISAWRTEDIRTLIENPYPSLSSERKVDENA